MAADLVSVYVQEGASQSVNISATVRASTVRAYELEGAMPTLFDQAADEVFTLMKKDTFRRFMKATVGQEPKST